MSNHRWVQKSFHYFPLKDPQRTKLWLRAAGLDMGTPMETIRNRVICSDHFNPGYLIKSAKKTTLNISAVPFAFSGVPTTTTRIPTVSDEEQNKIYCPFCGHKLRCASTFCGLCGKSIKFLYEFVKRGTSKGRKRKAVLPTVQKSEALKKESKLALTRKNKNKNEHMDKKLVKMYAGMMTLEKGRLKPVRGMVLPIAVHPGVDPAQLCEAAVLKMKDFDKNLQDGSYILLYPDGTKIVNIPGTDRPFTLQAYKQVLGKSYQRITVYICTVDDFYSQNIGTDSLDSSYSEVIFSDTVDAPGTSSDTVDTACNRCPDNRHQSTLTSTCSRLSVKPFEFYKDLQLLPEDKEQVKTIKKENLSPHQEDVKPPHLIKKEKMESATPQLHPDLYLSILTNIKTEHSSDTDDSEDWK